MSECCLFYMELQVYVQIITQPISGQEEGNVDYEEGMRFTPFNMKEEMEEGHFDTDGTYIFKKDVG